MQTSLPHTANGEQELISAAQQGDVGAYRKLYEAHISAVYGLACRLVSDRTAAEDVAQEVFIRAWKDLRRFRGDSRFATWLHRICSMTAISHLRRQRGWLKRVVLGDEHIPEIIAVESGDDDLDVHIKRLPERARIVFVLYAVEGYRHEEIAELCGMAVGSSKAQLHRARQLLQEWLNDE
ncbi:MAG: RNA polymerase sigma factor [Steroidobacter sp.]